MICSRNSTIKTCLVVLLLILTASSTLWAQTIVVLADTPYSDKEKVMLQGPDGILYQLINQANPSAVLHLGDFKSGGEACTDKVLSEHKLLLNQITPGKLIFTPGDNDWTDCDRASLTQRFDELERLDFLLELIHETRPLLDINLPNLRTQQRQRENKLWINDRLAVSTLHLVGTSNGRVEITQSDPAKARKRADERDQANFSWLKEIEAQAKDFDALIIGFQADIYQQSVVQATVCDDSGLIACDAFIAYRQAFKAIAKRLNKPVLVSHGDTGDFCFEKLDKNLWHLNAAGDFRYLDGATITFNKTSIKQPFHINGLLNPDLPSLGCNKEMDTALVSAN